jgi:hypothetical protein
MYMYFYPAVPHSKQNCMKIKWLTVSHLSLYFIENSSEFLLGCEYRGAHRETPDIVINSI